MSLIQLKYHNVKYYKKLLLLTQYISQKVIINSMLYVKLNNSWK